MPAPTPTPWPHPNAPADQRPWVLVTGGARRLGRCLCEHFAHAGWNVAIHHSQSAQQAQALCAQLQEAGQAQGQGQGQGQRQRQRQGIQAVTVAGTLDTPEAVAALFHATWQATGGRLHTVVCNASTFEPDTGQALDAQLLMRQMQVNLAAPMQLGSLLHAAVVGEQPDAQPGDQPSQTPTGKPSEKPSAGACAMPRPGLIHVLDQKVFNLNPDYFSYTLSKLALERAVALQAQALAPRLRVNAVAPGLMYVSGPQSEDNFARASRVNLLQHPINPADVARAAVFLASTPSCTGSTLRVDNGQHLVPLGRDVMFALDDIQPGILPFTGV